MDDQEWRDSVTRGLTEIKTEQRIFKDLLLDHISADKAKFKELEEQREEDKVMVNNGLQENTKDTSFIKGGIAALAAAASIGLAVWSLLP